MDINLNFETYEKRKFENRHIVDRIQQITEKLNFLLKEKGHPLLLYYEYIRDTDLYFYSNVGMLDNYYKQMEDMRADGAPNIDSVTAVWKKLNAELYSIDGVEKRLDELEREILLVLKSL